MRRIIHQEDAVTIGVRKIWNVQAHKTLAQTPLLEFLDHQLGRA